MASKNINITPGIWAWPPKTSCHPCEHGVRPEDCDICAKMTLKEGKMWEEGFKLEAQTAEEIEQIKTQKGKKTI